MQLRHGPLDVDGGVRAECSNSTRRTTRRRETMQDRNFTTAFTVDQTPEEAFAAITNVRGWWSGNYYR